MLKRLIPRRRTPADVAAVPAGHRVYAIGDVHGRVDMLDALLHAIRTDDAARDAGETTIVFLGDLVDRGPHSAAVIDRVLALRASGTRLHCLAGNHEEVFLSALEGSRDALRTFCRIGGRETILSYGVPAADYDGMDFAELAVRLGDVVPAAHAALLNEMEKLVVIGDYAFVHAGIRPGVPLAEQRASDLRWIREPFLSHRGPHERVVVHGHTIRPGVENHRWRIGIDTGAYAGGALTAVVLEGIERRFLSVPCPLAAAA